MSALAADPANRRIWQLSAGPSQRSYAALLTEYGVALVGPGDPGPWHAGCTDAAYGTAAVRWLASEAQPGDIVVLRQGSDLLLNVGLVAGAYVYLPQFDDVNGWDLQHGRRVRWAQHAPYRFGTALFGPGSLSFGPVTQPELLDYARRFVASPPHGWQQAALPVLPPEEATLASVSPAIDELVGAALDLGGLYADPARFGEPPAEHELVAHFVVPLLRTLGWQPEQIAVEWQYIDVAVFDQLPRRADHLAFVVEAKRPDRGVENHLAQARGYLAGLKVERNVVVTDGLRYRLYSADQDYEPIAYANLARLKPSALPLFDHLKRT